MKSTMKSLLLVLSAALLHLASAQEGTGYSKLLVVAGYNLNDLNDAEIVDVDNEDSECVVKTGYPHDVFGVAGALLDGRHPMVCGGYHCCGSDYKDTCHVLKGEEWVAAPSMSEKRLWSSATPIPLKTGSGTGFLVTGGTHLDVNALDSTEIFVPSEVEGELGSWQPGPKLPLPLEQHCLVTIDASTILLIGGNTPYETRIAKTFFLDVDSLQWTEGPDLQTQRDGLACAVLNSNGKRFAVAAAGFDGLVHLESVELLDLDQPDAWIAGPALPHALHNGRLVQDTTGAVVFVGGQCGSDYGFSDKLYRLDGADSNWVELKQTLKVGRNNHAAMFIPDEAVVCQ